MHNGVHALLVYSSNSKCLLLVYSSNNNWVDCILFGDQVSTDYCNVETGKRFLLMYKRNNH